MQVLLPVAFVALVLALAAVPVSGLTVPSAPLNLAAVAGNQQVTLTWDPPATDGGSAITNYIVYRDTVPGLGFDAWRDAAPPIPRPSGSGLMGYDPGVRQVVLFDGADTWVYDTEFNIWTLRTPAVSPPLRVPDSVSLFFDAGEGKVSFFVWTGSNWQYWAYDASGNTWVSRPGAGGASYRWDYALDYDTVLDRFYMFGGTCGGGCFFGETWRYEPATNSWSRVSTTGTPSPRWGHKMAFHPPSGLFVLFGGFDASGYLADTWTYDSSTATWTLKAPPLAPPARQAHRMVYDSASRSIVLFGGSSAGGLRDDTWAYDPVANVWTDLSGSVRPTARYNPGLAYDVGAGKLVLFGGSDGVVSLGDTWTFPGAEPIATLGSVLTFTDTGLTNGITYYYRVAARSAVGLGPTSNEVSATPDVTMLILGFYHPVDMGAVLNTVKNGATVPLKFEVFAGATEQTDTSVVSSLSLTKVVCATGLPTDAIEITATGGTSLRYDTTAGQFVYNWKTPNMGNTCWDVTLTVVGGSSITAHFKLR